ncbi:hypothetical protein M8494_27905 [Serratia ureilytica]
MVRQRASSSDGHITTSCRKRRRARDPGLCHHARRDPPSGAAGAFGKVGSELFTAEREQVRASWAKMAGLIPFCGYSGGL